MKKALVLSLIVIGCFIGIINWQFGQVNAKLAKNKEVKKQLDNFILHMRVDETEEGIQVLRSLQYMGEETVEIKHQAPLISVSLSHENHDFTGSLVTKKMNSGNIYTQEKLVFAAPEKGECNLYVQARFMADDEEILIEHVEKLIFK